MHLRDLFPELESHEIDNMPSLDQSTLMETDDGYAMCTPKPEACSGIEDSPMSEIASPPPQPLAATQTNRKPKGRSGGEKSSRTVKQMRKEAGKGDIEAAMKLGWGVDRITDIYNRKKAARGEKVTPGQPIDDPDLLHRITERHEYQAKIQKKRQNKLRVQAEAGDLEAAKKLKMGKKRLRQLFPHLFEGKVKGEQDQDQDQGKHEESCQTSTPAEELQRERTPAEPFDFASERQQMATYPSVSPNTDVMFHHATSTSHPMRSIIGETYTSWSAALEPSPFHMRVAMTPPRYPTTPMAAFDPKRALRREYEVAVQQVAAAQANLAKIAHELEHLEQPDGMSTAHSCALVAKRRNFKAKDQPQNLLWNKKTKKARPSNFPAEQVIEETPEAETQMSAPASMRIHAFLRY